MTSAYYEFKDLCYNLKQHQHRHIPSPSYQKRRAAVAAIIRCRGSEAASSIPYNTGIDSVESFFEQDWVKHGQAEILFMQRAARDGDRWSGHVSFVGGKNEPGETDEDTVKREVMEEIGIDLEDGYIQVGKLDEREITSLKDNKLLMILVPFVYLQVVPESPPFQLQTSEVAAVEWVPLSFFTSSHAYAHAPVTERLTLIRSDHRWIRRVLRWMLGSVTFPAVDLPSNKSRLRLWGLTLGMTSDIIEFTQKKHLAFLKLARKQPVFTRLDIQVLTSLIARLRSVIGGGGLSVRDKSEWDKVYFSSIRIAVATALVMRLGFASVFIRFLMNRIIRQ